MKRAATNAALKNLENYGIFNPIGQWAAIRPAAQRLLWDRRLRHRHRITACIAPNTGGNYNAVLRHACLETVLVVNGGYG